MTQFIHKRRICSYDMVEVSAESYLLVEEQGRMYSSAMPVASVSGPCIL